jgi:DNA-binding transcriptional MerR regulator
MREIAVGGDGIRAQKSRQSYQKSLSTASRDHGAAERPLKIGEAAKLVGVEAYVLRFWETQFACIRPKQARSRHRYYTRGDVETLRMVKHLLHTEGFTIAGARKFIREKGLDGLRIPVAASARSVAARKPKDPVGSASAASVRHALTKVNNNGIHRALRAIRDDLRALQKLLEA